MDPSLPSTVISHYGYGILKADLSTKKIREIKRTLTVRPFVPPGSPVRPEPFSVYMESPMRLWVPREWGKEQFGLPEEYRISKGDDAKEGMTFVGSLRPRQMDILKDWSDVVNSPYPEGRILTVPCGYGKTVMSLWCASQIGKKTLIVVHKEFLMNQFRSEIERFLPNAKVGRIQGNVMDIEGKDIVIGMIQTLVQRNYPPKTFQCFGTVIFDECHHLAAEVFSRVLSFIGCWRMLGLSATPVRKDQLSKVFHWHLGPFLANIMERGKEELHVWRIQYIPNGTEEAVSEYKKEPLTMSDNVNSPKLITKICEFPDRNAVVFRMVRHLIEVEHRKVLVLTDRKIQLQCLHEMFESVPVLNGRSGYYVGGMKEEALNVSASKDLVLGTYAMASEGMNVPELDTLILASPKSDIVQSVGRILRKKMEDREKIPLVIDIVDSHPSLVRQSQKRVTFYNKHEYTIHNGIWDTQKDAFQETKLKKKPKEKVVCEIEE